MNNVMEKHYAKGVMNRSHLLAENVDALRDCVKDLYVLDEDNYKKIQELIKGHNATARQVNRLTQFANNLRIRRGLRLLCIVGLIYIGNGILSDHDRKIDELQDKLNKMEEQDKTEESDG